MADDTGAQIVPETDTQAAPMPSADQQTTQTQGGEAAQTEVSSPVTDSAGLPEDAKERTRKEFEKLQTQLREERARREYVENVFSSLQPKQQQPAAPEPIYDSNTGLLNEHALTDVQKRAIEAEQRAARAEQSVQSYLEQQEAQRAFEAHPELDPDGKLFDKQLHVATRRILLDSMVNPDDYGGKQLSFKDAGDLAKSFTATAAEQAKKEGAREAIEQLTPKEQAALEAVGTPGRRTDLTANLDELRRATRRGSVEATMERLRSMKPQD